MLVLVPVLGCTSKNVQTFSSIQLDTKARNQRGALNASCKKRERRHTGNQEAHGFNATAILRWDSRFPLEAGCRIARKHESQVQKLATLHEAFGCLHVFRAILFPQARR